MRRALLFDLCTLLLALIVPLTRERLLMVTWAAFSFLNSLRRWVYWALLLVASLFIAFRTLRGAARGSLVAHDRTTRLSAERDPTVAQWRARLAASSGSSYAHWQLAQVLARLTARSLAQEVHMPAEEVRRRLAAGEGGLPPGAQTIVRWGLERSADAHTPVASPDEGVTHLVTYLEARLEGTQGRYHDRQEK